MTQYVTLLNSLGISSSYSTKLAQFQQLFAKWNASINLSSAKTAAQIDDHIYDSLHVAPYLRDARTVLDVGSGGGFPVVIAAICAPDSSFVALEPVHKKHAFLRTAARELELTNLEPLSIRVEDHEVHDYDAAMSRATLDLREWLELGVTLVRPGGSVIGFEAIERTDLPQPLERHFYVVGGKHRALVIVHRAS